MNKLTELWIKATGETEIEEYNNNVRELYDYTLQLEEDYKNELEENLKLSELWKKSQEEKRKLEANIDEAIKKLKEVREKRYMLLNEVEELLSTLERGKRMIDLRLGDCLDIMKDIPDKSIDMILCDLPYSSKKRKTTWNDWDCEIDLEKIWCQYNRIIKDNGVVVLFGSDLFSAELIMSNYKNYKYKWVWQKETGTGFLNAKRMPLRDFEEILVFYKKQPVYNPQMRKGTPYKITKGSISDNYCSTDKIVTTINDGERYPLTIIRFNRDKEKLHPTQKPVALLEYLIKTYTNENDVVLDNCMGSGSTGVACVNTNRNFIGIELDEQYYKIACERINKEEKQTNIFDYEII